MNFFKSQESGETKIDERSNKDLLLEHYSLAIQSNNAQNYPPFPKRLFLDRKPLNENGLVQFDNSGAWVVGQKFPTHEEKYSEVLDNYGYPKFCELDADYRPLHPWWKEMALNPDIGAVIGKGFFYHWGANYTADTATFAYADKIPHILLIKRGDTNEWALPGGFLEPGENDLNASIRELSEESGLAINDYKSTFNKLYAGPVLDIRTTLHAWVETNLWSVELNTEKLPGVFGNDDANEAKWFKLDEIPHNLYGSHPFLIDKAITGHF